MNVRYEVIYSNKLSQEMGDKRYIVIDAQTGEILDNANGYGYKSEQNAYRAFEYKLKQQEEATKLLESEQQLNEVAAARYFLLEHADIHEALLNASAFDTYTRLNEDGSVKSVTIYDTDALKREPEELTAEVVDRILYEYGYTDLNFSAKALLEAFYG
ncbi:hypothetical protein AALT52_00675 [Ligilactobacillus faecis]|uniref:Uncharacterized protein n=1 Tax=Ligilactobacillus faecis TaxID=762833 RepID=A0ABV4DPU4_9LACO